MTTIIPVKLVDTGHLGPPPSPGRARRTAPTRFRQHPAPFAGVALQALDHRGLAEAAVVAAVALSELQLPERVAVP